MSWMISQALMKGYVNSLSSPEQEAEFSEENFSDGEPSAQLSVMPTPQPFWRNDRMMEVSKFSRFGLKYAVLTADRGAELLTWYLAGFPARTFPSQERAQGSTAIDPAYGLSSLASLTKYDPDSRTWKTAQRSLLADSDECSVTWPRSGMTANGQCWELPMSGRRIEEIESGSRLPTPTAHNAKETNAPSEALRNEPTLASIAGGPINPEWTEWLMGWPIGWTDLKPSETDKSLNAPLKHGEG